MKRFIGLLLTAFGGVASLWGGYHILTGQSAHLNLTEDFSVTAMTGGLAGVAIFTLGLIWVRD